MTPERKPASDAGLDVPRAMLRSLPVISWELDAKGVFIRATGAALARLGISEEEAVGRDARELFPRAAPFLERALAGEAVQWVGHGGAPAESSWTFEVVATPQRDGGVLGISVDVTDRVRAEQRYHDLVEALPDILVATDLAGRLTALNATFEHRTGLRRADWLGAPLLPLVHTDDVTRLQRVLLAVQKGAEPPLFDVRVRCADGTYLDMECRIRPHREGGAIVGCQGIARDVTEPRRIEAELRHVQRLDSIDRLAGGVAHDFNNLLLVISGHAALIEELVGSDARVASHLRALTRSAERAAFLTRRLLAFGRKQAMEPQNVAVDDAVKETALLLGRTIGEDVTVEVACGAPDALVHVDPAQLEQVLLNLAVNARDAMPDGGTLRFATRVEQVGRRRAAELDVPAGEYAAISVADTGTGLDELTRSRVFDPFFTTKAHGKGTGLGLATVYGIVRQSGGAVTVTSEPGRGALFRVRLPLAKARKRATRSEPPAAVREAGSAAGERILLVEDDADVRAFMSDVLETSGFEVVTADDGPAALATLASDTRFRLVVLDVVMPRMSGFDVLPRVRKLAPDALVLFVSGYAATANADSRLLAADAFLSKPFLPVDLVASIHAALRAPPR